MEVVGNAIVGGVESYIHHLASNLPKRGYKVTCVAPYESSVTCNLRELGSNVYVAAMDFDPPWRSIQFLTEVVRQQGVRLIHAHLPRAMPLAGLVGSLTGVPVVITIHGMDISSFELGIIRMTGAYLNVVCQAAYVQALALGFPAERLHLISNGVDLKKFNPHHNGSRLRREFNLPAEAVVIGYAGRLAYEKGPDMFLQLAEHIHRSKSDVHFVMVGEGPMRAELAETIRKAGLDGRVHLAGVRSNMSEVYMAFDILVQTSRVEGMPLTLLEGMACALPVAAMNVGGVAEIVEVGTTGYLSAAGDWAGLGDAVIRLIDDATLRKQMSRAARQRVEQKFDLNAVIALIDQEFRGIVQNSVNWGKLDVSQMAVQETAEQNGLIRR